METTEKELKPKSLAALWLISVAHGMTHWYPSTFYILLPIIGLELGLSFTEIGFILTFKSIISSISGIPGGMIVDIVGRKGLLMAVSLFWIGFPYLVMSFTHSYVLLVLCMALVGIGNTLWHPTAIPALAQRYPNKKGFALSIHGMGANLGDALAPLAVGALLAVLSWRDVVVINVIPGILMGFVILYFLRNIRLSSSSTKQRGKEKQKMPLSQYFSELKDLAKNKSLVLLSVSSAFRSMTQSSLRILLPLYLAYELELSALWVGVSLFLLQASGFIAGPIAGYVSDRIGRKKIIMSSMAMTAVILLFMAFAGKSYLFIFFIALLGFFLFAVRPVLQAWLMETTPKQMAGTSISILFSVQSLGSSVSPLLGGIIADTYGLFAAFYFVAATIIIANLLIFFMPKDQGENIQSQGPSVSV